jgi:hypothetical protein
VQPHAAARELARLHAGDGQLDLEAAARTAGDDHVGVVDPGAAQGAELLGGQLAGVDVDPLVDGARLRARLRRSGAERSGQDRRDRGEHGRAPLPRLHARHRAS